MRKTKYTLNGKYTTGYEVEVSIQLRVFNRFDNLHGKDGHGIKKTWVSNGNTSGALRTPLSTKHIKNADCHGLAFLTVTLNFTSYDPILMFTCFFS